MAYTTISSHTGGNLWPSEWGTSGTLGIICDRDFLANDGKSWQSGDGTSLTGQFVTTTAITVAANIPTYGSFILPKTDSATPINAKYIGVIFDVNGVPRDFLFSGFDLVTSLGDSITFGAWWNDNAQTRRYPYDTVPTTTQMNLAIALASASVVPASTTLKGIGTVSTNPVDSANPDFYGTNDTHLPTKTTPIYYASQFASVNAAITAIGSTVATLIITAAQAPITTVSIPATLTLAFEGAGSLLLTTGQTITILSDASNWPSRKIFFNAVAAQGTVSFSGNTVVQRASSAWWGTGSPALTAALAAIATATANASFLAYASPSIFSLLDDFRLYAELTNLLSNITAWDGVSIGTRLNVEQQTSASNQVFVGTFGVESSALAGDKVAIYGGACALTGSTANVFGANFLAQNDFGAGDIGVVALELDTNNNDRNVVNEADALSVVGLQIVNGGAFSGKYGLYVGTGGTGNAPWHVGLKFGTNPILSSGAIIDMGAATGVARAVIVPNAGGLIWKRAGGTEHEVLSMDATDNIVIGRGNLNASFPSSVLTILGAGQFFQIRNQANSVLFQITETTGAVAATSLVTTGLIKSSGTAGIGYATGAGGTVSQLTSKATGVTLDKTTGGITIFNDALAAGTEVSFVVTNSTVAATDVPVVAIKSGGTLGAYSAQVSAVAAGSFTITISNLTAGSLSEALVLSFVIIKGVAA